MSYPFNIETDIEGIVLLEPDSRIDGERLGYTIDADAERVRIRAYWSSRGDSWGRELATVRIELEDDEWGEVASAADAEVRASWGSGAYSDLTYMRACGLAKLMLADLADEVLALGAIWRQASREADLAYPAIKLVEEREHAARIERIAAQQAAWEAEQAERRRLTCQHYKCSMKARFEINGAGYCGRHAATWSALEDAQGDDELWQGRNMRGASSDLVVQSGRRELAKRVVDAINAHKRGRWDLTEIARAAVWEIAEDGVDVGDWVPWEDLTDEDGDADWDAWEAKAEALRELHAADKPRRIASPEPTPIEEPAKLPA